MCTFTMKFSIFTSLNKLKNNNFIHNSMVGKVKLLLLGILLSSSCVFSQAGLGTLKGKVKDAASGAPLGMSKVVIIQNSAAKGGTQTDADGEFQINGIQPGTYNVKITNPD